MINTSMLQCLAIDLAEDADISAERLILAARAKELFGDRFLIPETARAKAAGFRAFVTWVDGVPIRYMESFDLSQDRIIWRLQVMGYPEEAIIREITVPPPIPASRSAL